MTNWNPLPSVKSEFATADAYFKWAAERRANVQRLINSTDAAAECCHGCLAHDRKKPEWCFCWVDPAAGGAVAEGARW